VTATSGTILVTGGAGFIGANLVPRLEADGASVRVYDSLVNGHRGYLAGTNAEIIEADIRDRTALDAAMADVDAVLHLAAAGSVVDSVAQPKDNFDCNVRGSFEVLDAARTAGIERLVFSSTGGALIGNAEPPVDEQSLPKPISPYGASKLATEAYCHAFARSYGLRTVALRFANVYGPYSGHKKGAMTAFFKALHSGEPMVIFGDGRASRDFMHVSDICAALQLGLVSDVEAGSVMHVATGVESTVTQLADACRQAAGKPDHPIVHRDKRPGEVERNFADYGLAAKLMGFEPKVSLLEGLADTWTWYCDHVF
jgi:UDP-glucose 4-epimerase